jgi:hypothetical protein
MQYILNEALLLHWSLYINLTHTDRRYNRERLQGMLYNLDLLCTCWTLHLRHCLPDHSYTRTVYCTGRLYHYMLWNLSYLPAQIVVQVDNPLFVGTACYSWVYRITTVSSVALRIKTLTLNNPIFLPPAYSTALIYFGREWGWWIICNYPTVLKEKNRNRNSTTCAICWLKSVQSANRRTIIIWFSCSRRFSSCITDFRQQIAQVVLFLFLFMFFCFKNVW